MLFNRIMYFLLLFAAIIFLIFLMVILQYFFLLLVLCMPIISFIIMFFLRKQIVLSILPIKEAYFKNEKSYNSPQKLYKASISFWENRYKA